jgi:hypothetical protein
MSAGQQAQTAADTEKRESPAPASAQALEAADREARRLQEGPGITLFGGQISYRALIAIGIFIAAFMAVWVVLWAGMGGVGLGLGWIPAAAAGVAAVGLFSRSSAR